MNIFHNLLEIKSVTYWKILITVPRNPHIFAQIEFRSMSASDNDDLFGDNENHDAASPQHHAPASYSSEEKVDAESSFSKLIRYILQV